MSGMDRKLIEEFSGIIKKYKIDSLNGKEIIESEDDKMVLEQISSLISQNEEYNVLINELLSSDPDKVDDIVNNYFGKKQEEEQAEDISAEDEIANLYGVSVADIKSLHLKNGNELFKFYSPDVGKEIVLVNGKEGESLKSQLQQMQELKKEYQTDNEKNNSKNIMMDIRNNSNLEITFYPVSEIKNHQEEVDNLSDDSFRLLQYIIANANDLDVQLINLDNLVYLDSNNNLREVTFDMNHNPSVGTPDEKKNEDNNTYSSSEISSEENSSEIDEMLSSGASEEQEKENLQEKRSNKVYQKTMDTNQLMNDFNQSGFVSNAIIIIGLVVLYFLVVSLFVILR